jgi:hypothetical protein
LTAKIAKECREGRKEKQEQAGLNPIRLCAAVRSDLPTDSTRLPRYASGMLAKEFKAIVFCAVFLVLPALSAQRATTATVAITVVDDAGARVPHAQIRVVPPPDPAPKMETDDRGRLSLDLKPGGYGLFVQMLGFKSFATHVEVQTSKEVQTILVVLQAGRIGGVEVTEASPDVLVLRIYPYYDVLRLSVPDFKLLPHIRVSFHNSHTNANETYSGVRLADLLSKMGAPLGDELRGEALADYVVATGADGYKVVLALGEVDPAFHPGEVVVADAMNGKPLDAHSGPFKLVVTEDKRPARSVRNLTAIELKSVQ